MGKKSEVIWKLAIYGTVMSIAAVGLIFTINSSPSSAQPSHCADAVSAVCAGEKAFGLVNNSGLAGTGARSGPSYFASDFGTPSGATELELIEYFDRGKAKFLPARLALAIDHVAAELSGIDIFISIVGSWARAGQPQNAAAISRAARLPHWQISGLLETARLVVSDDPGGAEKILGEVEQLLQVTTVDGMESSSRRSSQRAGFRELTASDQLVDLTHLQIGRAAGLWVQTDRFDRALMLFDMNGDSLGPLLRDLSDFRRDAARSSVDAPYKKNWSAHNSPRTRLVTFPLNFAIQFPSHRAEFLKAAWNLARYIDIHADWLAIAKFAHDQQDADLFSRSIISALQAAHALPGVNKTIVADFLIERGMHERARKILSGALASLNRYSKKIHIRLHRRNLISLYGRLGALDEITKVARTIKSDNERWDILEDASRALLKAGHVEQANVLKDSLPAKFGNKTSAQLKKREPQPAAPESLQVRWRKASLADKTGEMIGIVSDAWRSKGRGFARKVIGEVWASLDRLVAREPRQWSRRVSLADVGFLDWQINGNYARTQSYIFQIRQPERRDIARARLALDACTVNSRAAVGIADGVRQPLDRSILLVLIASRLQHEKLGMPKADLADIC